MASLKKEWLTVSECAESIGVSQSTIRRAIRKGELEAVKGRKLVRISVRDWRRYLAEHWPYVDPGTDSALSPLR